MRKKFNDINVTPLVDVMLVLLVVFMVTAPLMTVGIPVDLPHTSAAQMTPAKESIVITITKDGALFINEQKLSFPELVANLRSHPSNALIYVRADQGLSYGQVMQTMGALADAGFKSASLLAEMAKE